ncbi:MAG TPA: DUF2934 domain-containing protein [Kaistia sp.]|nr:DUF2934 domain-containing protein [Kaistia sp.]
MSRRLHEAQISASNLKPSSGTLRARITSRNFDRLPCVAGGHSRADEQEHAMPGKSDEAIRIRAYEIWLAEGQPHGREWDHWLMAVAEVDSADKPAKKGKKPAADKPASGKAAKTSGKAAVKDEAPKTAAAKAAPKAKASAKPKTPKTDTEAPAAVTEAGTSAPEATSAAEAAPEQAKPTAKKTRAPKAKAAV